jgi:hypothetical protein
VGLLSPEGAFFSIALGFSPGRPDYFFFPILGVFGVDISGPGILRPVFLSGLVKI